VTRAHRDSSEKSLWYVCDDDTDKKDDCVQPLVAEDEGYDKERDAEEDSHAGDEMYKVSDLVRNGRLTRLYAGREVSYPTHDGTVTGVDDNTTACT